MTSETVFTVGSDPDTLEKIESTGCLRRLGAVLTGLGVIWLALLFKAHEAGKVDLLSAWLVPGGLLLAGGVFCLLVRGGSYLDRRRQVEVSWWNVAGWGRRKETSFAGCARVELEKDSGDGDSSTTYPVRLAGAEGVSALRVDADTDYQAARRAGEAVARFLSLPLYDRSAGELVVRLPAELDEPLRSRLRRTGGPPPLPSPPATPKARIERTPDGQHIEIVGAGSTHVAWLPVGCTLLFAALVLSSGWSIIARSPWPLAVAVAAFLALPLIESLRSAARHVLRRTVIVAGPFGLRIEAVFLLGRRVVEIPPEELEELILLKPEAPRLPSEQASAEEWKWSLDHGRMPDGTEAPRALRWAWRLAGTQGILARSDRQSVTFAAGLPPDELAYLHALLLRALA